MSADLEGLAAEAVAWMRAQAGGARAEVYLSRGGDRSISRRAGARDAVEAAESLGAGVRVVAGGRAGFASAGGVDAEGLRALWRRAVEQLPHAEPRPGLSLPEPSAAEDDPALADSLWDESLFSRPWEALEAGLARAEAAAEAGGRARCLRSDLSESRLETVVASTTGLLARERSGGVDVSVSAAAAGDALTQVGEGSRFSRRAAGLDLAGAGDEAGRRAAATIGARRVRAGRRAVLLEPWAAAELLETLSELLSAEAVQGGRSLLAGKVGEAVGSPLVTLRDDPRLPGGPASALFDDEGVPTRDKALIAGGVLREFLHDSTTAARDGIASNGCAWRGGWSGPPAPGPSNLYLAPGTATREALLSGTRDGLLVMEMLGAHMIDHVSGEFSVGVSGLEVSRGELARPFHGAMISGNLLDLLARVDGAADDLLFYGGFGSPTIRVSELDVA